MKPLNRFWVSGLKNKKDKDDRYDVLSSELGIDMLYQHIKNKKMEVLERQGASSNYDSPNWQLHVAHANGEIDILNGLLLLLNFKEKTS